MKITFRACVLPVSVLALISVFGSVHAQRIEPRAYINAPVGVNFLVTGYLNSSGALLFDPAIPVTDADANVGMAVFGYVRTLDIAGNIAGVPVCKLRLMN